MGLREGWGWGATCRTTHSPTKGGGHSLGTRVVFIGDQHRVTVIENGREVELTGERERERERERESERERETHTHTQSNRVLVCL